MKVKGGSNSVPVVIVIVVVAKCWMCFVIYLLQVGAILVFVPGWEQISKLNENIKSHQFFKSGIDAVICLACRCRHLGFLPLLECFLSLQHCSIEWIVHLQVIWRSLYNWFVAVEHLTSFVAFSVLLATLIAFVWVRLWHLMTVVWGAMHKFILLQTCILLQSTCFDVLWTCSLL